MTSNTSNRHVSLFPAFLQLWFATDLIRHGLFSSFMTVLTMAFPACAIALAAAAIMGVGGYGGTWADGCVPQELGGGRLGHGLRLTHATWLRPQPGSCPSGSAFRPDGCLGGVLWPLPQFEIKPVS